jgi:hypothetical protein
MCEFAFGNCFAFVGIPHKRLKKFKQLSAAGMSHIGTHRINGFK